MESSAIRALEIGINVFIFVIALTCAMLLLTNVLRMSELANDVIKDTTGSTLLELYGNTNERIYSGTEVIAVITEYFSDTSYIKDRIVLQIYNGGAEVAKEVEENEFILDEFNSRYHLVYSGLNDTGKEIYTFEKI